MAFDFTKAIKVPMQGTSFDISRATKLSPKNINIYDAETKTTFNAPPFFNEDKARYAKSTQIDGKLNSDFWGMTETKNSIFSQLLRGGVICRIFTRINFKGL